MRLPKLALLWMLKGKALAVAGLNPEDSKARKPRSSWIKLLLTRILSVRYAERRISLSRKSFVLMLRWSEAISQRNIQDKNLFKKKNTKTQKKKLAYLRERITKKRKMFSKTIKCNDSVLWTIQMEMLLNTVNK